MKALATCLLASTGITYGLSTKSSKTTDDNLSTTRNAICILYPDNDSGVHGLVSFQQQNVTAPCNIIAHVRGLKPNSLHGFHIHEFGDLTEGCKSAGGHFNPWGKTHGGPLDKERHIGDLGNLKSDDLGVGYVATTDHLIKLFGDQSVIGRSVVVHADEDDVGRGNYPDSKTTGHAGARLACGTIGLSANFKNLSPL
jgi:Cu-Zn family superoxide dismutase